MYYAINHPYGLDTMSKDDTLHRFETRAKRDAYTDGEQFNGSCYHRETVTREEARRLFPRAFAALGWTNSGPDETWSESGTWQASPTGGSYEYM